ncbi:MAG: MarR family winged helix-turn-helix transcriptional regulator [Sciscionella sp.]
MSEAASAAHPAEWEHARRITDVVTRLRRALRTSIRSEYPWESRPMAQVEVLMALAEHSGAPVGKLAELLRLRPNTISGLVQQLVDAGLAERRKDPEDRRVALVELTVEGRRELHDWQRAHEQRMSAALDRLPPRDRAAVIAALPALDQLIDHLIATSSDTTR